jgi:pyruvate dehydrogenase E2 component (dihydrolipoamide acetyltransferase)
MMSTGVGTEVLLRMPALGADMTEGRITEWLVAPGQRVDRGQIALVVETDKSDIEVEVFQPGTVTGLLVAEGERVAVGTPIATIEADRADLPVKGSAPASIAPEPTVDDGASRAVTPPSTSTSTSTSTVAGRDPGEGRVTSPLVRELATQLDVDVEHLHGSRPGGRVTRDDVLAASHPPRRRRITPRARRLLKQLAVPLDAVGDVPIVTGAHVLAAEAAQTPPPAPVDPMRARIASLMTSSWSEIPHYHVSRRLDLMVISGALRSANEIRPLSERILPGAVLMCAAARAAARESACNGHWRNGRFEPAETVRLGVVLSLRSGGIIVPTICDADRLSPSEMMGRLAELVQRARHARLRASDVAEATITVTNLGDLGAEIVNGIIHPPQVALVGFGGIHDEVWAVGGEMSIRSTVHASLAGDHRAIDGLAASRYLARLQALLDEDLAKELS